MLQLLVNFIFFIIKTVSNIILAPIMLLVTTLIPDVADLITGAQYFLSNYVFNLLGFLKNAFMNITGYPQNLFNIVVSYILVKISLHLGMSAYRLVLRMWETFKP